jgi:hypothetical protein
MKTILKVRSSISFHNYPIKQQLGYDGKIIDTSISGLKAF